MQIYHNAVRYALDDDIFTSTNQFNSARNLIKQGRERAKQLAAHQAPWNTKAGLLALKKEIEGEAMHLASDDLKLAELKRKKLHLKDEIQKVRDAMKPRSVH